MAAGLLLLLLGTAAPLAAGAQHAGQFMSPKLTDQRRGTGAALPAAPPTCNEVSTSLGSHMVLQRSPESAVILGSVCGKLAGAKSVSVAVDGGAPTTVPIASGSSSWAVKLPPQVGGLKPHTVKISGGSFAATLDDVLFGDVILCSGQSNMNFAVNQMTGAHAEIALANETRYQSIRLFTAKPTYDSKGPHADVTVLQNWSVANSLSVGGGWNGSVSDAAFSYFSAACWVQGRHLFDRLGGDVPLGLLTSAVGGTRVHCWSSADALKACPQYLPAGQKNNTKGGDSDLWNTMIAPLLPMRFKFVVWLQSESDVCAHDDKCTPQRGALYYTCAIKAMVTDWRKRFKLPLPFLWVQISPWEGHEAATTIHQLPAMRLAQMAANDLPLTGMATAVDLGPPANAHGWDSGDEHGPDPWGNVHFRNKGPLGPRLSSAALNIVYGNQTEPYRGPEAATVSLVALPGSAGCAQATGLSIKFKPETVGGGLKWVPKECPYLVLKNEAHLATELDCRKSIDDCIAKCAWFDIELGKGSWHQNATATLSADEQSVVLSPPTDAAGCPLVDAAPTGARYLYGDWPVATLFNDDGFPALPFKLEVQ